MNLIYEYKYGTKSEYYIFVIQKIKYVQGNKFTGYTAFSNNLILTKCACFTGAEIDKIPAWGLDATKGVVIITQGDARLSGALQAI